MQYTLRSKLEVRQAGKGTVSLEQKCQHQERALMVAPAPLTDTKSLSSLGPDVFNPESDVIGKAKARWQNALSLSLLRGELSSSSGNMETLNAQKQMEKHVCICVNDQTEAWEGHLKHLSPLSLLEFFWTT